MRKQYIWIVLVVLAFGIIAGCGNKENEPKQETGQTEQKASETATFPLTVEDGTGNEVTIDEKPERIVSVIPSTTEIAYALGLGEHIRGVSDYDNYPEDVLEKEKVGGLELNIEKIISLDPQLVLADESNPAEGIQQLRDAGIPVFVVAEAKDFDGVYQAIQLIGTATGTAEKADSVIADMKEKVAAIVEKAKQIKDTDRKRVLVEFSPSPEIYAPGSKTFANDILHFIHAENVISNEEGWVQISEESILKENPDVIITTYGSYVEDPVKEVTGREGWQDVTAVKEKQVFDVNEDIVSRPGPRLVEGVEELAKTIYPEIFAN